MGQDRLAELLGVELVEVEPGRAVTRLVVDDRHLNGAGVVHGGVIFALADIAFAAASNAHGTLALALDASITFVQAVRSGTLEAEATEASLRSRVGVYDIRICADSGELVAVFRGTVYRKKDSITTLIRG